MEDYEVFWFSKHMSSRAIQLTQFGGTFNCMYPAIDCTTMIKGLFLSKEITNAFVTQWASKDTNKNPTDFYKYYSPK